MRTIRIAIALLLLLTACDKHAKHPHNVPTGDDWRVPAQDRDGGAPPAPSAQPASGEEIHI